MAAIRGAPDWRRPPPRRRRLSATIARPATIALVCLLLACGATPSAGSSGGAGLLGARGHGHHAHRRPPAGQRRVRGRPRHRRVSGPAQYPLAGRAVWIWELGVPGVGSPSAIARTARRNRVTTVLVKASDGTQPWSQFSASLLATLHAAHLRVCAWQYVYGNHPATEAALGADAVRAGADCLVVDAESEYEGKYVAAQTYIRDLRRRVGGAYPLALAGFPYVDVHPGFPYSVFLGPGGAQMDVPQMYWRDIGSSVDAVYASTYAENAIYGRPIFPLGQIFSDPPTRQIVRFRELAQAYGARGLSWWDWQLAGPAEWTAISAPERRLRGVQVDRTLAPVGLGAAGDVVVWAQEHLAAAGFPGAIDGDFGRGTEAAVIAFQRDDGLVADGVVGEETWRALLRVRPVRVTWRHRGRRTVADEVSSVHPRGARARADEPRPLILPAPSSAIRPARRDEIPGALGAGRPTADGVSPSPIRRARALGRGRRARRA